MSQQDMQKIIEGLRVFVEWLQSSKKPIPQEKTEDTWRHIPEVLRVNDLIKVLNVSKGSAYELCRRPDFPAITIGRRILIPKDRLRAWLDKQTS